MKNTRHIVLDVVYQGKNISKEINNDLIDISINDVASNSADDISITLQDKEMKWLKNWVVEDGDKIEVKATSYNWNKPGEEYSINFGTYFVDEPTYTINPGVFSLNATSIPNNKNFRDLKRTKIWKNAKISTIAEAIAKNNEFTLYFDSTENPTIKEEEQSQTSDMEFLKQLCNNNGLNIKIYQNILVIYSESAYEIKIPKMIVTPEMIIGTPSFTRSLTDSGYDKAVLKYTKGEGETLKASFERPKSKSSKILSLNDSVDSQAEALRICKAKLREKNKEEYKISFALPGLVKLYSAETIEFREVGQFSGIYFIDSKSQSLSPTSASFEAHKILGY